MANRSPPSPPPPSTSAPPPSTTSASMSQNAPPHPSSQSNANPPVSSSSTQSSPLQLPPPTASSAPPPTTAAAPPPPPQQPTVSPPSRTPPSGPPPPVPTSSPPPSPNISSPSNPNSAPPTSNAPPPSTPLSAPPPPPVPRNLPPPTPPITEPPKTPPPPPASPKPNSPPPPQTEPPKISPPPPPTRALPPSTKQPPDTSPSSTSPPAESHADAPPPPSASESPQNATPPLRLTPSSQPTPSQSNSVVGSSPPTSVIRLAPPPYQVPSPPSDNPTLNVSNPNAPEGSGSPSNSGVGVGGAVAVGVAVGIIVLSLIGLAGWCWRKQKRKVSGVNGGYFMPSPLASCRRSDSSFIKTHSSVPLGGSTSSSDVLYSFPSEPGSLGHSRSCCTYEELVKATNGFSEQNLLGEGGFGAVYHGWLPDGRDVAVKQLKIGGGQGEREFKAEVEIISRIHHRHLVSLVGYCISGNQRLLVYDYVPNNSLYFHLHAEGGPVLDWATRVKIAAGAARGIAYLHEDCHPRIIHRDIKSSNILLDSNFEARVSDFGLAKLALDANTHVTTRVMGTFGYMAPEYASSGKLTEKSDVFSYGVVLLELITGRKPVDASQPMGDESLVEWARPWLSHALESEEFGGLVDPRLGENYVESEMLRMVEAAAACVRHSAAKRPQMGQVVRAFDSLATSDLSNGMKVGESEAFNPALQSEEIRWFRRMAFGSQNYSTGYFIQNSLGS